MAASSRLMHPAVLFALGLAVLVAGLGMIPSEPSTTATATAAGASTATAPFRVCVMSDDMPLSHDGPDEASGRKGLYLDLAEAMAASMNESMTAHFAVTAFYKRPVREGLLAKKCDAFFGLPRTEGPWFIRGKVALTEPITSIGYALVTKKGEAVTSLSDFKGRTVGVQGGSPGALAVALSDGVETYTVRYPEPALDALHRGEIDAALIWGPRAGYLNKHVYDGAFDVHPTSLEWPVAIGVRSEDQARVETFNRLIEEFAPRTEELRAEYGLPADSFVEVYLPGLNDDDDESVGDAGAAEPVTGIGKSLGGIDQDVLQHETVEVRLLSEVDYARDPDEEAGRRMFNAIYGCAHCHGTDAKGADSKVDLRLLRERYGDEAEKVFMETVKKGRDNTAMPPWDSVISDEKIEDIKAFVFSVQKPVE